MAVNLVPQDSDELRVLDSAGCGGALDELYRRYASILRAFCYARLGNGAEAEDACHEAILKLNRALPNSRPGPVWPWLATIARNVCIDIKRSRGREAFLSDDLDLAAETLEEEVDRRVRSEVVLEALKRIPEHYAAMIRLRHYNSWSYEEIANFHHVTVATVKSTLYRARKSLGQEIEKVARGRKQWPLPALSPWSFRLAWDDPKTLIGKLRSRLYGETQLTSRSLELIANTALATMLAIVGIVATVPTNQNISMTSPTKVSTGNQGTDINAIERHPLSKHLSSKDSERSAREIGTPSFATTVPVWDDETKEDPRVAVPPVTVKCSDDPGERGALLNIVCLLLEDSE